MVPTPLPYPAQVTCDADDCYSEKAGKELHPQLLYRFSPQALIVVGIAEAAWRVIIKCYQVSDECHSGQSQCGRSQWKYPICHAEESRRRSEKERCRI